jgi:hypothetical protein
VITPVLFEKTPVRLADPPAVTAVGLAAKLVIVGAEEEDPPLCELHPVRRAKRRLRANARKEVLVTCFIASPVTEATKRTSVLQTRSRNRYIQWEIHVSGYLWRYPTGSEAENARHDLE